MSSSSSFLFRKRDTSRARALILGTLMTAAVLQAWVTLLEHAVMGPPTDMLSAAELASISPHVEWDGDGIQLLPLLKFLNESADIPGPNFEPNQPDDLYILDKDEAGDPRWLISMNGYWKHKVSFRRRELTTGLDFIESSVKRFVTNMTGYPRIQKALQEGGFPFVVNWDSTQNCSTACCDESYEMDPSRHIKTNDFIPVLRLIAPPTCHHRLFTPTAKVMHLAMETTQQWDDKMRESQAQFKRQDMKQKVVWRGDDRDIETIAQLNKELFEGNISPSKRLCALT